jgi:hypothetical protein
MTLASHNVNYPELVFSFFSAQVTLVTCLPSVAGTMYEAVAIGRACLLKLNLPATCNSVYSSRSTTDVISSFRMLKLFHEN